MLISLAINHCNPGRHTIQQSKRSLPGTSSGGKAENNYQCQGLSNLTQAKSFYEAKHQEYCASVTACLKSRLAWSDLTLIQYTITVLATQGWQKCLDEEECESEADLEIEKLIHWNQLKG